MSQNQAKPSKEKDTRKRVLFTWPDDSPDSVLLAGSFNDWEGIPMRRAKESFLVTVPLDPGDHQYKFIVDGEWIAREDEPTIEDPDGNINNLITLKPGGGTGKKKEKKNTEEEQQNESKKDTKKQQNSSKQKTQNEVQKPKKDEAKKPEVQKARQDCKQPKEDTKIKEPQENEEIADLEKKQVVNPWNVEGGENGVDYDFLVKEFGTQVIDEALLKRFERVSGHPLHPWFKRGLFFSHRSLNEILDAVEKKEPFFLYTGRGPSSEALHLGHMVPFMFTKWLQDVFDVPLVIQLTDDEKFFFKDIPLDECSRLGFENAKDIIACGFDINKTFIFRDTDYLQPMYHNIAQILHCLTVNQVKNIFGLDLSSNSGKFFYPAVQAAPSFSSSFPHIFGPNSNYRCLIPCAIDQDPFFRMTRDIAPRMNLNKPAVVLSKFFPALQGSSSKMSASTSQSAIFMTDSPAQIAEKVNNYAFSGGRATMKEHREKGGDLNVDVPYQYLKVFEFDDAKLGRIGEEFGSGRMLSSEIKKELAQVLVPFVQNHQEARAKVTDQLVWDYMKVRPLKFRGKK